MKDLLIAISIFLCLFVNAQVGIGTTDPQQDLHISGNNSTIRIDGLNSSNNSYNYGSRPAPIYTNSDGDLTIPPSPTSSEFLSNGSNMIGTPINVLTGAYGQINSSQLYKTASFRLTQPAMVMIQYSISLVVFRRSGIYASLTVDDGKPRLITNYFYIWRHILKESKYVHH